MKKFKFAKTYNLDNKDITKDMIEKFKGNDTMFKYNNSSLILNHDEQTTKEKLGILKNNELSKLNNFNCYQEITSKNYYVLHFYILKLLEYLKIDINDYNQPDKRYNIAD